MTLRAPSLASLGAAWAVSALVLTGCTAEPVARAGTGTETPSTSGREVLRLENPKLSEWRPQFEGKPRVWRKRPARGYTHLALPKGFFVPIFDTYKKPRRVAGRVRRGVALSVRKVKTSITCFDNNKRGSWYEIRNGGYLCSTSSYDLVKSAPDLNPPQRYPAVEEWIPFKYARVITNGTARLSRRPTLAQYKRLEGIGGPKDDKSGLMVERMIGDFFLSLDVTETIGGTEFYRTVHNEYAESSALKLREPPQLVGEHVSKNNRLPIAFLYGDDETKVYCADGITECGTAEKHARFNTRGLVTKNGQRFVRAPKNTLIPASAIRLAERRKRPPGVKPDDKWVHIDLERQTFVAYEGDRPVYASLISSGKDGHTTPSGLYRMQRKYLTKTMRAVDPKEGLYHIEDIPYVMYYYGSYALHGAFWHNVFGEVRSHGCTNLMPPDARWLYHWSQPEVPAGWQAIENIPRGTAFYFTNKTDKTS